MPPEETAAVEETAKVAAVAATEGSAEKAEAPAVAEQVKTEPAAQSPAATPGIDEDKLGRGIAKGLTDALRHTGPAPTDRPLAKYTTDQLLAAKFETNADGSALAPAQLLTIERELETKRREDLYAASQFTTQRVAGRSKVERDYPEFADPTSPLYLKAVELAGYDPSVLTAKELDIVVKAAAHEVGLQPLSKRSAAPNPVVQARQQTVEQIQQATAAASLPRGTGGSAAIAPIKSPNEMTYQEVEEELTRRRGY